MARRSQLSIEGLLDAVFNRTSPPAEETHRREALVELGPELLTRVRGAIQEAGGWPEQCGPCGRVVDGKLYRCAHCPTWTCPACVTGAGCPVCIEARATAKRAKAAEDEAESARLELSTHAARKAAAAEPTAGG